jgi:hypothetical protein
VKDLDRYVNMRSFHVKGGPVSSVGIATDYGLDGPGIESRWGPTQPPVQWIPGLSRGKAAGACC